MTDLFETIAEADERYPFADSKPLGATEVQTWSASRARAHLPTSNVLAEEWRVIPEWPEYEVSSFGRVRPVQAFHAYRIGKCLKLKPSNAYYRVGLCRKSTVTWMFVHRLVASAFLPAPLPGQTQVAHNNGIGTDNRIDNLRWDTPTGNAADRWVHGGYSTGEQHCASKMTWHQAEKIRAAHASGEKASSIVRRTGLSKTTIYAILRGERWGEPGPRGQADARALERK